VEGTEKLSTLKDTVREQFGTHAAAYATSHVHAKGASLQRLVELVGPEESWRMLDIAAAAGHTAWAFAPYVAHATVTDITPEMLAVATDLATKKGIDNFSLGLADAEWLPFRDVSFELVTCRIAPHHFPHIGRFVAESCRVLILGGYLAVVDNVVPGSAELSPAGDSAREAGAYINAFERLRDPSHVRCLCMDEWRAAFSSSGLNLQHVEMAPKRMEFRPWAQRMGAEEETIEDLRQMLTDAPAPVSAFLLPQGTGDTLTFQLLEAILIGQKPT
jgi:ubiquinone/menaquinone biosynthesis C-methylase UbiE